MHKNSLVRWFISSHGVFVALAAVSILVIPAKFLNTSGRMEPRLKLVGAEGALGQVAQVFDPVVEEPIRPAGLPRASESSCGLVGLGLVLLPGGLLLAHGVRLRRLQ